MVQCVSSEHHYRSPELHVHVYQQPKINNYCTACGQLLTHVHVYIHVCLLHKSLVTVMGCPLCNRPAFHFNTLLDSYPVTHNTKHSLGCTHMYISRNCSIYKYTGACYTPKQGSQIHVGVLLGKMQYKCALNTALNRGTVRIQ